MSDERWLVTGALGCIGAWCCRQLVREGCAVVAFDLGEDRRRAELVMTTEELAGVEFMPGDITDLAALVRVLDERRITHVIHLAAMLVPLAAADPPRGALVNPTLAMAAAARGDPYRIPFGGRAQFQYAPDAARAFIDAARSPGDGARVRNLGGPSEHVTDVIAAIEAAAPEATGTITFAEDVLLPLPEDMEAARPVTSPLVVGVRETIELLRGAVA